MQRASPKTSLEAEFVTDESRRWNTQKRNQKERSLLTQRASTHRLSPHETTTHSLAPISKDYN